MRSYKKALCWSALLTSILLMGTTNSYAEFAPTRATKTRNAFTKKPSAFANFFSKQNDFFFAKNGLSFADIGTGVIANDEGKTVSLYGGGLRLGFGDFSVGLDYKRTLTTNLSTDPTTNSPNSLKPTTFYSGISTPGVPNPRLTKANGRLNTVNTTINGTDRMETHRYKSLIGLKVYHPTQFKGKFTVAGYIGASLLTDTTNFKETRKDTATTTTTAQRYQLKGGANHPQWTSSPVISTSNSSKVSTLTLQQKYLTTGMRFEAEHFYLDATIYTPIGKQTAKGTNTLKLPVQTKRDPLVTFMVGAQF